MSWVLKEKLQQTLQQETGAQVFAPGSRQGFALIYPNTYHIGMSNLGMHIIYKGLNDRRDTACERFFLPDKKTEQEYVRTNTPLLSLETQRPLYEFPLIGFSATYEMDYFNILKILELGKVTLLAAERTDYEPLVIIGGPCATFNPEPLADFIDIAIIGEGEETMQELLDAYYAARAAGTARHELLRQLAQIEGVYVPRFYQPVYRTDGVLQHMTVAEGIPAQKARRWVADLDAHEAQTVIMTADTEFGGMHLVEVARGCGRHCRFCMAGYCFRQPRVRSLSSIQKAVDIAKAHGKKVGLMGAAISDYPDIDALCAMVLADGSGMSVASLRADSLTPALVQALADSHHKTITMAPETASERMRMIINKGITDAHMTRAISLAVKAGIPHVKLYIMVGLPWETMDDVAEIVAMTRRIKAHMEAEGSKGKLTLSVNPFIPKPFTPFQTLPMDTSKILEEKLNLVQKALKKDKNIEVWAETPKESVVQAVLARGDRRLGAVLLAAGQQGGWKAFKRALKAAGLTEDFYIYRTRPDEERLPWQHLNMGFTTEYLAQERERAVQEIGTAPCQAGCKRCGVCG